MRQFLPQVVVVLLERECFENDGIVLVLQGREQGRNRAVLWWTRHCCLRTWRNIKEKDQTTLVSLMPFAQNLGLYSVHIVRSMVGGGSLLFGLVSELVL